MMAGTTMTETACKIIFFGNTVIPTDNKRTL